jgi:hypothetical protein
MPPRLLPFANAVLPGCILVVRGLPGTGALCLGLALAALSLGGAGPWLPSAWQPSVAAWPLAYAVASALASVLLWWRLRPVPVADAVTVKRLHRTAAAAYLRSDHAAATAAARDLAARQPGHPGVWRLLELVCRAAGDHAAADQAAARAVIELNRAVEG